MRILVVAGGVPYPPTWGSGMRTFQLIRQICGSHDVSLLCPASPGDAERVSALRGQIPSLTVHTVTRPPIGRLHRRARQVATLASADPFLATEVRSAALQKSLDLLLSSSNYDIVQLEGSQLGVVALPPGPALVLNEHNVEFEVLDRMRRSERSWVRRTFNTAEFLKYRRYERRQWLRADAVALPSKRETEMVRDYDTDVLAATVPNAVDTEYFRPGGSEPDKDTLVFTGLLSYRPNFDAALYLVDEILPLVRRSRPETTLTIVGDGDPGHFEALRRPGVRVTGRVEDLRPHVQRAAVCCAPVRMGGGTRLKVLEALAMGKPLVSTSLGSEGIEIEDGRDVRIADTTEAFAEQILELFTDPGAARRMGTAGRTVVERRYTWVAAATELQGLYDKAMARRSPVARAG